MPESLEFKGKFSQAASLAYDPNKPPPEEASPIPAENAIEETQAADIAASAEIVDNTPPPEEVEPPIPFGALGVDAFGLPNYGSGVKGWIRQTFSDLFDPTKFKKGLDISEAEEDALDKHTADTEVKISGFLDPLAEMGIDIEGLTGLSSQDFATAWTDMHHILLSDEPIGYAAANTARIVGVFTLWLAWGGIELLQLDWAMRKVIVTDLAIREFSEVPKESPIPLIFDSSMVLTVSGISGGVRLGVLAANIATGKVKFSELTEHVSSYWRASEMAYTMAFEAGALEEFNKQVAAGKDPQAIARDLQNPWIELIGSIFGDPTTYLGLGIPTLSKVDKAGKALKAARFGLDSFQVGKKVVNLGIDLPWNIAYRLPEFGELISPFLKVGRSAAEAKAASWFFPETKLLEDAIRKSGNASTNDNAIRELGRGINQTVERIQKTGDTSVLQQAQASTDLARQKADDLFKKYQDAIGTPNEARFKTLADEAAKKADAAVSAEKSATKAYQAGVKGPQAGDYSSPLLNVSTAKAAKLGSDFTMVIASLVASGSPQQTIDTLRTLRAWGGTADIATKNKALQKLIVHPMGKLLLSARARALGAAMDLLNEKVIDDLLVKFGKDPGGLAEALYKHIDDVLKKVYVSADDMFDASRRVKDGSRAVEDLTLAARYDVLPAYVKISQSALARLSKKIHGVNIKTQSLVYMGWNPGYAVRNVTGQTTLMMLNMGVAEALRISAASVLAAGGDIRKSADNSAALIGYYAKQMEDMGIPVPSEMYRAFADVPKEVTQLKKLDVRPVAQNIERTTGAGVINKNALDFVEKYGGKAADLLYEELLGGDVPEDVAKLLMRELQNAGYNEKKGFPAFLEKIAGKDVPIFRDIPMPTMTKAWAKQTGVYEAILKAQKEAASPEEFMKIVDEIFSKQAEDIAEIASKEAAVYGERAHQAVPELVSTHVQIQAEELGGKLRYLENGFTGMVNAYQNANFELDEVLRAVQNKLHELIPTGEITKKDVELMDRAVNGIERWWGGEQGKYKRHNQVMDATWSIYNRLKNGESPSVLWKEAKVGQYYDLSKIYPNVDPAFLSEREFQNHLWTAYFDWGRSFWNNNQQRRLGWKLLVLEEALAKGGKNLGEFAVENLGKKNPLTEFQRQVEYLNQWNKATTLPPEIKNLYRIHPADRTIGEIIPDENGGLFDILGINYKHALNMINKDRAVAKLNPVVDLKKVTIHELLEAAAARFEPSIPAPYEGGNPSMARAFWEAVPGAKAEANGWKNLVADNWGATMHVPDIDPSIETLLRNSVSGFGDKMSVIRTEAAIQAVEIRNKLLFDYNHTYLDLAMSYLKPFGYWTNQAYKSSAELVLANPKYASWYMSVKEFQMRQNADKPKWYQQMVGIDVPKLGGIFINLEAGLNPVYSLTGTDFDDPKRRIDNFTATIDEVGKIGGANNTLINWAVALYAYSKGEKEAARRWAGRMLPQSAPLKAVLNADILGTDKSILDLLGIKDALQDTPLDFLRTGDLDPLVMMQGGLDPYEEGRVLNQLAAWVDEGKDEAEKNYRQAIAIDAAHKRSGEIWDAAVNGAIDQRGVGKVMGFFGGPSFQVRTEADAKIQNFYDQYYRLMSSKNMMSAEQYRQAWDVLREKNPFMDVLLIGRKSGLDRDEALAYNVLGRLPPGTLSQIAFEAGISPELISVFYENKGFEGWSELDIQDFTLGVFNLHTMLAVPDNATRQDWTEARNTYSALQEEMENRFGENIQEKINMAFHDGDFSDPRVQQAMEFQNAMVMNNPVLSQYYSSLNTIENYYFGIVYDELDKEYPNMDKYMQIWSDLNMQGNSKEAKLVYEKYHLEEYLDKLSAYRGVAEKYIVDTAAKLPEKKLPIRSDFAPDSAVQSNLANLESTFPTWDALTEDMPDILQENVRAYFDEGKKLNYASRKKLEYLAKDLGYSSLDEYLRYLGISLQR